MSGSRRPQARCPVRPGEWCTLCLPAATGPQDCGLVWLVMGDPELRAGVAGWARARAGDGSRLNGPLLATGYLRGEC